MFDDSGPSEGRLEPTRLKEPHHSPTHPFPDVFVWQWLICGLLGAFPDTFVWQWRKARSQTYLSGNGGAEHHFPLPDKNVWKRVVTEPDSALPDKIVWQWHRDSKTPAAVFLKPSACEHRTQHRRNAHFIKGGLFVDLCTFFEIC